MIAPLIETKPPLDTAALSGSIAALQGGFYSWLIVTSSATVEVLQERGVTIPATTSIAAVGKVTSRSLEEAGYQVSFRPFGVSSSHALVEQWRRVFPQAPRSNILVMRSDLASATVSDDLELAGHLVDVCISYRTVGVDLAPDVLRDLVADQFDSVLLTSLSVAMELARQLDAIPRRTLFASLGSGTAREANRLGLRPSVTAAEQSAEGLLDAVERYFVGEPDERYTA